MQINKRLTETFGAKTSPVFAEFTDQDEYVCWKKRGDIVLHIKIREISDILLIAPLSANTLAKMVNGLCDNLVTSVFRCWPYSKNPDGIWKI